MRERYRESEKVLLWNAFGGESIVAVIPGNHTDMGLPFFRSPSLSPSLSPPLSLSFQLRCMLALSEYGWSPSDQGSTTPRLFLSLSLSLSFCLSFSLSLRFPWRPRQECLGSKERTGPLLGDYTAPCWGNKKKQKRKKKRRKKSAWLDGGDFRERMLNKTCFEWRWCFN